MALALGRWHTGPGGLALAHQTQELKPVAERALQYLNTAIAKLNDQGIDPWVLFARIHAAKAWFDFGELDAAERMLSDSRQMLDRFPVFVSHAQEAVGQMRLAIRNPDAGASLRNAMSAAQTSGLTLRRDLLAQNYGAHVGGDSRQPDA